MEARTVNGLHASAIAEALQAWIEDRDDLSTTPSAFAHIGLYTVQISIGDTVAWDSETDREEDMTTEYCKQAFLEHVYGMQPFWAEAQAQCAPNEQKEE